MTRDLSVDEGQTMISSALREKIIQVLEKSISIDDLENWMVPRLRSLIQESDSFDSDAVSAIELGLAEMRSGIRTEKEFFDYLHQVLQEYQSVRLVLANRPNISFTLTDSSSNTITPIEYNQQQDAPIRAYWAAR